MKGPWRIAAQLYWCGYCNVPLLEPKCGLCGEQGTSFHASPPKDVRPSFKRDLRIIRTVVAEEEGERAAQVLLPQGKLVLMNKVAYVDQADEVIVDGWPIGTLYFNPELSKWRFKLSAEGAARLWSEGEGYWARLEKVKVEQWRKLSRSDVKQGELPNQEGHYVYLVSSGGLPIGLAVWLSEGLKVVKVWRPQKPHVKKATASWSKALEANRRALEKAEARSRAFLKGVSREYLGPKIISFSGGKDSLACLLLCLKELGDLPMLFNDTGLEMPETVKHVEEVAEAFDLDLLKAEAGEAFWESLESFGPPSRDYRWCCKVCKLIPITRLLKQTYLKGTLTFLGQRRYESFNRARAPSLSKSWWIKGSLTASPINDWSSLQVWLYLMKEKVNANPLYRAGFDRVGCWLCPSCELAEFKLVEELHPELWKTWEDWLTRWARDKGLPEAWVNYGFWRWRQLPGDQKKLAERLGVRELMGSSVKVSRVGLTVSLTERSSLCLQEPLLEVMLHPPPDTSSLEALASTLGGARARKVMNALLIKGEGWSATLSVKGKLTVKAQSREEAEKALRNLVKLVARTLYCNRCGSCVVQCPVGCVELNGTIRVDPERCTGCGICNEVCPVAAYIAKEALKAVPFSA